MTAALVAMAGVWLLFGDQAFIPADAAPKVARLCFGLAVADLAVIAIFKRMWRKQDGR